MKKTFDKIDLAPEVCLVVGTRPGIIMFSAIIDDLLERKIPFKLIHSGQHYSENMDSTFFNELKLPKPDFRISGVQDHPSHAGQTAKMMVGIEKILMQIRPCLFLVGGDANTNLAAALAAAKLHIPIAHIEAGERSFDRKMPEEQNRIIIDHLSDFCLATDSNSESNLEREGLKNRVSIVGNPIVDATLRNKAFAQPIDELLQKEIYKKPYAILTMHREENVDNKVRLKNALLGAQQMSEVLDIPTVFIVHPRTKTRLEEFGLMPILKSLNRIIEIPAVGYLQFSYTLSRSILCLTDSGGVQQEACIHKIPTITLRDTTEWKCTLEIGANRLVGCEVKAIVEGAKTALNSKNSWEIPFGGIGSADRIAKFSQEYINQTYKS